MASPGCPVVSGILGNGTQHIGGLRGEEVVLGSGAVGSMHHCGLVQEGRRVTHHVSPSPSRHLQQWLDPHSSIRQTDGTDAVSEVHSFFQFHNRPVVAFVAVAPSEISVHSHGSDLIPDDIWLGAEWMVGQLPVHSPNTHSPIGDIQLAHFIQSFVATSRAFGVVGGVDESGVQGTVVSADDSQTGTKVAIKKLHNVIVGPKTMQRTIREFLFLTTVNHRNIIRTLSVFTPHTTQEEFRDVYLVMELMTHNLSEIIKKVTLDHENLSYFIYQILCGVNHLHRENIYHRDLKPCNIAVNDKAEVKVLDFGLARLFNTTEGQTAYVVTRHYRAPEVVCGRPYTKKVDIWSIGCILAELITGEVLFPGKDKNNQWDKIVGKMGTPADEFINQLEGDIANYVRGQPPVSPKSLEEIIPDKLFPANGPHPNWTASQARHLIAKMLAFDPNERYSAEEALNDPYVRKWYRENEVHAPLSNREYDEETTQGLNEQRPTVDRMKQLIFDEVKRIETSHDIFSGQLTV